jgi:nuclear receptor subfamily 2 group B member 4
LNGQKEVEGLRSKVYACLDEYCRQRKPNEDGRFAQILLRLPPLRSMSLKCVESLSFYGVMDEVQIEGLIKEQLSKGI